MYLIVIVTISGRYTFKRDCARARKTTIYMDGKENINEVYSMY